MALAVVPATIGVAATSAGAASSNKVTITAGEYTYKVSGSPKPGNVEVEFKNAGVEYHMMGVVHLKPKVTVKQLKTALLSNDPSAGKNLTVGDGNVADTPNVLGPDQATTTIANLPAGHYGLYCFIPAPDGKSHIEHGMVKVFDVKGGKSSYKPPTDGVAEVSITDAGITLPSSGLPANTWVKVTNNTSVARDLTLAEYLTPDATYESGTAYFNDFFSTGKLPAGDPPASINGGITGLAPNSSGYLEVSLKNGSKYVLTSSNNEVDNDPNQLHADFTAG
jgi:hypothetical protein